MPYPLFCQCCELLGGLEARGLLTGSAADGPGPTQLTAEGAALNAKLAEAVAASTRRLSADIDPDDLATAHRVADLVDELRIAGQLEGVGQVWLEPKRLPGS
jgi:hypothetical protein